MPMRNIGVCSGCGETKNLVKAHVVPEAFCKLLVRDSGSPLLVSPGNYAKRSPIGIYDQNILCDSCERLFSSPDDYGFRLLCSESTDFEAVRENGSVVGHKIQDFNFQQFKLFVLSVLWRAAVSKEGFYKGVDLGPHLDRLKDIVLHGAACGEDEFSFACGRLTGPRHNAIIFEPFKERIDGVNHYRLYIGPFHFWIKVDARPSALTLKPALVKLGNPLFFISRDFNDSPEFKAARQVARLSKQPTRSGQRRA